MLEMNGFLRRLLIVLLSVHWINGLEHLVELYSEDEKESEVQVWNSCASINAEPVIVVVDMDTDDILALLYLLKSKEVKVSAIIVEGNGWGHLEQGIENVHRILAFTGQQHNVAVGSGSKFALYNQCTKGSEYQFAVPVEGPCGRHGVDNIIGIKDHLLLLNKTQCDFTSPVQTGIETLKNQIDVQNVKKILSLAPLTTISLFRQKYPATFNKLEAVYIMGGALFVDGNLFTVLSNTVAEFNVFLDPHAAKDLIENASNKIRLVPLDFTDQINVAKKDLEMLESNSETKEGRFVSQLLHTIYRKCWPNASMFINGYHLWDPVAALVMVYPDQVVLDRATIVVEANWPSNRTVDGNFRYTNELEGVEVTYVRKFKRKLNSHHVIRLLHKSWDRNCIRTLH